MATKRNRRGQALVELAVGMVAVSLVLSAIFAFSGYIGRSLTAQRTMRAEAGRGALGSTGGDNAYSSATRHETLEVSAGAEQIFGAARVEIVEEVHLPVAGIQGREVL